MNYSIKNDCLTVEIKDLGAELQSIKGADGTEYLWQGDPKYWTGRSLTIFPYVARLTQGKYTFRGKTYEMPIHGFGPTTVFEVEESGKDYITFRIDSTDETRKVYPFDFIFREEFKLEGNTLKVTFRVDNKGTDTMYFGLGGHPGFNAPLVEGLDYTDYRLDFMCDKAPTFIKFTDDCFVTDERSELELRDGRYYDLHHDMFDNDAIIITDTAHKVRLETDKDSHSVEVDFDGLDYFGFWHWPKTDAPYICLEPWSSLPSRKDVIEDLETQKDLISLPAGEQYSAGFTMIFK